VLPKGGWIAFDPVVLDGYDELVVDQFIAAAYLLVTGTDA
jgi:hypothetical protein